MFVFCPRPACQTGEPRALSHLPTLFLDDKRDSEARKQAENSAYRSLGEHGGSSPSERLSFDGDDGAPRPVSSGYDITEYVWSTTVESGTGFLSRLQLAWGTHGIRPPCGTAGPRRLGDTAVCGFTVQRSALSVPDRRTLYTPLSLALPLGHRRSGGGCGTLGGEAEVYTSTVQARG